MNPELVVIGSLNLDISVEVPTLPGPGETVLGGDALWTPGGKGANQAVAAARLGRSVAMVGCVGDDDAGETLVAHLSDDGVECALVERLEGVSSGLATIAVDAGAENQIVVSPGANARLGEAQVVSAAGVLRTARVVLFQFEVPIAALVHAAQLLLVGLTSGQQARLIINPAPAPSEQGAELAELLALAATLGAVIVPNRLELAQLLGVNPASSIDEVKAQAAELAASGMAVVVTMGSEGALLVKGDDTDAGRETVTAEVIAPVKVEAVDTTAAGDSFCGALADGLVRGLSLGEAVRWANAAAALTVTRRGAQASLPTRAQVSRVT